jgi:hypothetical protein
MENLKVCLTKSNKLVLIADLNRESGFTKSGTSVCIATSGGNINLWEHGKLRTERFNLNVFRPMTKEEKREGRVFLKNPDLQESEHD